VADKPITAEENPHKNGLVEKAGEAAASLKDIGLGTKSIANRLASIGIVGTFVIIFVWQTAEQHALLREEMATNRESSKSFLSDIKAERDRQDMKWQLSADKSDAKHAITMKALADTQNAIKENQRSIQDSQKSFDRAVDVLDKAVKAMMK
jgi:hypothetical protein